MAPSDRIAEIITGLRRDGYGVSGVVEREWLDVGVVSYALSTVLRGMGISPGDLAEAELPTLDHYLVAGGDMCADLARLAYDYWRKSGNVMVSKYSVAATSHGLHVGRMLETVSCARPCNFRALVERHPDTEARAVLPLWVRYDGLANLLTLVIAQAWVTAPSFVEWVELIREAFAREDRDIPIARQALVTLRDLLRFENQSEFRRWC